jgi:hypothetical protein
VPSAENMRPHNQKKMTRKGCKSGCSSNSKKKCTEAKPESSDIISETRDSIRFIRRQIGKHNTPAENDHIRQIADRHSERLAHYKARIKTCGYTKETYLLGNNLQVYWIERTVKSMRKNNLMKDERKA